MQSPQVGVHKDFRFKLASFQEEFDCLLTKKVKISGAEPKIRGSIWHNAHNISVKTCASSNNRESRDIE